MERCVCVCVGETCSITSVGQCVCQKIGLVYFTWCFPPAPCPTRFISWPRRLQWCVSAVTPGVPSVSGLFRRWEANPPDPRPLPSDPPRPPQLIRCARLPKGSAPIAPLIYFYEGTAILKHRGGLLLFHLKSFAVHTEEQQCHKDALQRGRWWRAAPLQIKRGVILLGHLTSNKTTACKQSNDS